MIFLYFGGYIFLCLSPVWEWSSLVETQQLNGPELDRYRAIFMVRQKKNRRSGETVIYCGLKRGERDRSARLNLKVG